MHWVIGKMCPMASYQLAQERTGYVMCATSWNFKTGNCQLNTAEFQNILHSQYKAKEETTMTLLPSGTVLQQPIFIDEIWRVVPFRFPHKHEIKFGCSSAERIRANTSMQMFVLCQTSEWNIIIQIKTCQALWSWKYSQLTVLTWGKKCEPDELNALYFSSAGTTTDATISISSCWEWDQHFSTEIQLTWCCCCDADAAHCNRSGIPLCRSWGFQQQGNRSSDEWPLLG